MPGLRTAPDESGFKLPSGSAVSSPAIHRRAGEATSRHLLRLCVQRLVVRPLRICCESRIFASYHRNYDANNARVGSPEAWAEPAFASDDATSRGFAASPERAVVAHRGDDATPGNFAAFLSGIAAKPSGYAAKEAWGEPEFKRDAAKESGDASANARDASSLAWGDSAQRGDASSSRWARPPSRDSQQIGALRERWNAAAGARR